jgi:hypothetical protein
MLVVAAVISFVISLFDDDEDNDLPAFIEPLVICLFFIANAAVGIY